MKPEKILKIIEEKEIFTVKTDNDRLLKIVKKMEDDKKLEYKDHYRDCLYFGKADGRAWSIKGGFKNE